jgi:alkanesulfonate monooxygenase SsuD/methylene tetrahydromethanopterin reductase-like flavin-dependent oxidoreductase (luciferase family)
MLDAAVRATSHIPVATGIIPVDSVSATDVIATYRSLQRDHPGRFVVGLGGAHGHGR